MKRFLSKLSMYAIPILILAVIAELRIRSVPNNYSHKETLFLSMPPNIIDTIILGSSHTLKGVNPAPFGNEAFNYAHVSQSYDIDLAILKALPDTNNLSAIILPVSMFSFFSTLGEGQESYRIAKYQLYTELDVDGTVTSKIGITNWSNDRSIILSELDSSLISIRNNGWEDMTSCHSKAQLQETSRRAFARHSRHGPQPNPRALKAFKSIVHYCEEHEVHLILVTLPAHEEYRNLVCKHENWLTTQQIVKDAIDQSSMVSYINYFEKGMSLETRDYHDADHLSESGAEKLSVDLALRVTEN